MRKIIKNPITIMPKLFLSSIEGSAAQVRKLATS
jgi:hypothetical protein